MRNLSSVRFDFRPFWEGGNVEMWEREEEGGGKRGDSPDADRPFEPKRTIKYFQHRRTFCKTYRIEDVGSTRELEHRFSLYTEANPIRSLGFGDPVVFPLRALVSDLRTRIEDTDAPSEATDNGNPEPHFKPAPLGDRMSPPTGNTNPTMGPGWEDRINAWRQVASHQLSDTASSRSPDDRSALASPVDDGSWSSESPVPVVKVEDPESKPT
ncbi:hypothetical protein M231_06736 [Tremella mesenterica]|uniref:Uncharacterized protein n=1 Tax=Tremella mesenterica TaxID=5217 RepID=A0A4Q1BB50_TREME|nr:hypothetical protein M231_06736 [Tremella mesenterica]